MAQFLSLSDNSLISFMTFLLQKDAVITVLLHFRA
jgi:hypothetical protein